MIKSHLAYLVVCPSNPSAVMKMLIRTVKKTKTVATLFILFNLACFLASFRSYFTAGRGLQKQIRYTECWWARDTVKKEAEGNNEALRKLKFNFGWKYNLGFVQIFLVIRIDLNRVTLFIKQLILIKLAKKELDVDNYM